MTPRVAYFSMEIGIEAGMPTYAGGLGVLAGDTVRSAADLGVPMVAVTLVHRRGTFRQRLDVDGTQIEEEQAWDPGTRLALVPGHASARIDGRAVRVRAWRFDVGGLSGVSVPVIFLDTDVPGNRPADRRLTDGLYGGNEENRLKQEAVLALGGLETLERLGFRSIETYHLNEGHAALIVPVLLRRCRGGSAEERLETVRSRCVFTTHTPVPAGHDRFDTRMVERVLGADLAGTVEGVRREGELNMTRLALAGSRYCNGVSRTHAEVARVMFPGARIEGITNGVHAATWAAPPMAALFDRRIPGWRRDPAWLRGAEAVPDAEFRAARRDVKGTLMRIVRQRTGRVMAEDVLTIGFARRATGYKRAALVFHDLERLRAIARYSGKLQFVFAGKAHPNDGEGKALIREVVERGRALGEDVPVVYLENYDLQVAGAVCAGCDVWLNTPRPPLEASGTSGMKAAINGVPSFSVLDGWWAEGCLEGVTGWAIGEHLGGPQEDADDLAYASSLYDKLGKVVIPCFYRAPDAFRAVGRNAVAVNGSYFNTHRMVAQYAELAYRIRPDPAARGSAGKPPRAARSRRVRGGSESP